MPPPIHRPDSITGTDQQPFANGTAVVGGQAVIATFGPEGPTRCSGLDVRRYDPEALLEVLGPQFDLLESHSVADHENDVLRLGTGFTEKTEHTDEGR